MHPKHVANGLLNFVELFFRRYETSARRMDYREIWFGMAMFVNAGFSLENALLPEIADQRTFPAEYRSALVLTISAEPDSHSGAM